ncbi:MAG: ABC transporter substrate-binding protein [Bacteroidales bacterium]|nr:ABC transporter substrate-binding protein [Bacteroidales bacterium]
MRLSNFFLFCFLSLLLASTLNGCRHGDNTISGKTVFRYNESSGITSLDPAFSRNQANIWAVNQLYNGLVQLDDSLKPIPCIANSWEISKDGLLYTFHLRSDVYFHDDASFAGGKGRTVNASDFVFSFSRILDPKLASPGEWIFGAVSREKSTPGFVAIDDSTLLIRLKQPFPPFLGLLSTQYCSVVPFEAVDLYKGDFRQHPVGTGPFHLALWKEGIKMVLLRNPKYFESQKGHPLPYLDAVAVTFIVDKQSAFLEFMKGNLDFMSGIDASYKDELLTRSGTLNPKYEKKISLIKAPYLNTEYLGIQMDSKKFNKSNPLSNVMIRRALNSGIDKRKMMLYLRNNIGKPGTAGFVPSGLPWFNQKEVYGYDYNPELSKKLLTDAGYPGGKGLPPITLTTNASYLDLCKYIQSQLNDLGFDIRIDVTPPATLREMMAQSKVPFFRGSWIADYPDAENYLSLFYSPNFCPDGPNYTHYSNTRFDQLYREATVEINDSVRGLKYMQMDNLLMEDAPVIILYYDEVLRFHSNKISQLGCNPLNLLNLKYVKKTIAD